MNKSNKYGAARQYKKAYKKPVLYKQPQMYGYDGVLRMKIHGVYDMYHSSLLDHADLTVNWCGNNTASGVGATARVTTANEMTTFAALYTEYKIVRCDVKVVPIN